MADSGNNSINKLLSVYTKDYRGPMSSFGLSRAINAHRPRFYNAYIPMMMNDPHLWYGMELIKGPIASKAKFIVESDSEEVSDYVARQLDNFWMRGISKALDSLVWGFSGSEVIYRYNTNLKAIEFYDLKFLHQKDIRPEIKDGALVGARIKRARKDKKDGPLEEISLRVPKIFWTVHDRKHHRWFGRSRLVRAFDTWFEIWQTKGYRAIRHLWFYKNAYSGGILYYPYGSTKDPDTGAEIPNSTLAQEILDRMESGAALALPQKTGDNREWEVEPPKGNPVPEGLLDYGDVLRDEMWEGIGVPPEVAKSEGTGAFAGRRVPQQAFYSYIQEIANEIAFDFDEQVVRNLVSMEFGIADYEIQPVSILQTLQQEEMGLVTGKLEMAEGVAQTTQEIEKQEEEKKQEEMEMNAPAPPAGNKVEDRKTNANNAKEKNMAKK